jgi:hypothetical protein
LSGHTEYRLLTRDETLELGVWFDSSLTNTSRRYFASREELLAFARELEAQGWELISATTRPAFLPSDKELPRELWVFCRPAPHPHSPGFP